MAFMMLSGALCTDTFVQQLASRCSIGWYIVLCPVKFEILKCSEMLLSHTLGSASVCRLVYRLFLFFKTLTDSLMVLKQNASNIIAHFGEGGIHFLRLRMPLATIASCLHSLSEQMNEVTSF